MFKRIGSGLTIPPHRAVRRPSAAAGRRTAVSAEITSTFRETKQVVISRATVDQIRLRCINRCHSCRV